MKIPLCLSAALALTGCYTQLYTRGYAERTVYAAPESASRTEADSIDDSLARGDSSTRTGTVIVNNYYRESPYYRGYRVDEWDYPYFSFGFYSGRYRDYYGPYWWSDPYYRHGRYYRHYDNGYSGGGVTNPGPYKSDKRLFAPAPSEPPLHKGRRSEAAPAPKVADPAPAPAPDESSRSSSSSDDDKASSGSSGSSSEDHPALHKGRRR